MGIELRRTARLLAAAIADGVFPGAAVEVGRAGGVEGVLVEGSITYAPDAPPVDHRTIYDLASLTKVVATTTLVLQAVESSRMRLDDPVGRWVRTWTGADRQAVTIQDLLEHASGLPAHRRYFESRRGRAAYSQAIGHEPLEAPPRTRSAYSDLGFMLLGFALEAALEAPLDLVFDAWRDGALGPEVEMRFRPGPAWLPRIAPTEVGSDGVALSGRVHDENAEALGGVAGHAGLFGTAGAVGDAARWWLTRLGAAARDAPDDPALRMVRRSTVPGSSRAMGWDTMLPTSSCGTRLSAQAIGHTGFTGTSLWLDPGLDLYIVFLSNRVHPSRDGQDMARVRPALHDAVMEDMEGLKA